MKLESYPNKILSFQWDSIEKKIVLIKFLLIFKVFMFMYGPPNFFLLVAPVSRGPPLGQAHTTAFLCIPLFL